MPCLQHTYTYTGNYQHFSPDIFPSSIFLYLPSLNPTNEGFKDPLGRFKGRLLLVVLFLLSTRTWLSFMIQISFHECFIINCCHVFLFGFLLRFCGLIREEVEVRVGRTWKIIGILSLLDLGGPTLNAFTLATRHKAVEFDVLHAGGFV